MSSPCQTFLLYHSHQLKKIPQSTQNTKIDTILIIHENTRQRSTHKKFTRKTSKKYTEKQRNVSFSHIKLLLEFDLLLD